MGRIRVVWARESIPAAGPSVFLAGPTPRSADVPSWRPHAGTEIECQWTGPGPLTVFTPESCGGRRAAHYDDQVEWEQAARDAADVILFWIPRDLATMPGFTTNVEFGLDAASGRVVLGCPPHCPNPERNRYLIWQARRLGVPVCDTLENAVFVTMGMLAGRRGPHRRGTTVISGATGPIHTGAGDQFNVTM